VPVVIIAVRAATAAEEGVEEFRDPGSLTDEELDTLARRYAGEHRSLCLRRWVMFDRIDLLQGEKVRRLRDGCVGLGTSASIDPLRLIGRANLSRRLFTGTGEIDGLAEAPPLLPLPLVRALSDEEVRALLSDEKRAEDDVSLRRQVVWHRLLSLRAEAAARGIEV
jgi:hypothetical protein